MIFEVLFDAFLFLPETLILLLPDLPRNGQSMFPMNISSSFVDVFKAVNFFIPIGIIMPIIIINLLFDLAKITIAIIVRLKSFIPTMGA